MYFLSQENRASSLSATATQSWLSQARRQDGRKKRKRLAKLGSGGGKRYRVHKVVGNGHSGSFGGRSRGVKSETVAIKKVILDRRCHNRELEMMKGMDHDRVIRPLNHF